MFWCFKKKYRHDTLQIYKIIKCKLPKMKLGYGKERKKSEKRYS